MDCSKSEKSQGRKSPYTNIEKESLIEKEKTLAISQNLGIIDDIPYDETSPLMSNRLQGVCSSPISLPSSSIHLNSKLDSALGRTGSLSPAFQFTNDLSVLQSSETPTESLLPSVKQKDENNDEKFETSLASNIVGIYPNQEISRAKTLVTRDSPKTPKNLRKFTTKIEFLDEFQPLSKKVIEMEDNQLVEESSKKFTPVRLQSEEILESKRSSRSLTRKRKLLADEKSARYPENDPELKQKKPSKFKRRRICKDISKGNSTHDKLDIQAEISLDNQVSEDARADLQYTKTCSNHDSKATHSASKNRNSCSYLDNTRYSKNNEYTNIYENSTQTQIIQPSRSPIITRNVSSNLKKASTLEKCSKKQSLMKNSPLKKRNDKNTQKITTSLTKLQKQKQKPERLDLAEDDEFEFDSTDTTAAATLIEVCTDKVILSNSSINPNENNVTTLHETNNEEIQITTTNSTTTTLTTSTNNKSTKRKHQELSSDSKNTPKSLQNLPVSLPLPNHNKFCRDIILGKLDLLISAINQADLRKGDVSLIEDKMMDAKRALYEAERRSRSS